MEYVVFSKDALYELFYTLRYNAGTIFSVFLTVFMISLSIYAVIQIISFVGRGPKL